MTVATPAAEQTQTTSASELSIVFFDGVCGLCNSFVDFVMPRDRHHRLHFAALQGETAQQVLPEDHRQLDTVVYASPDGTFVRSAAIVRILWKLGGFWGFAGSLLWVIPAPLRDLGYKVVASQRYRLFGKKETCRLPTPAEAGRILP